MIAALPMYDWPALAPATDAFWAAMAGRLAQDGIGAPESLTRPGDAAAAWCDPELLIGQTCGMPFVSGLCGAACVIARPDYGLADAQAGRYCSVIVARAGEPRRALTGYADGRVAVNEWGSFSGHVALRAHLGRFRSDAAGPFFGAAILSGSHRESARMVARGEADLAALDSVAWALLQAHEADTVGSLAVLDRTAPASALPFITAPRFAALAPRLVRALEEAAAGNAVTGLPCGVLAADDSDYAPIRTTARAAAREAFAPGAPPLPRI